MVEPVRTERESDLIYQNYVIHMYSTIINITHGNSESNLGVTSSLKTVIGWCTYLRAFGHDGQVNK